MTDSASLRAELVEALAAYDRPRMVAAALDAVNDGSVSIDALYRILSEILVEIGAAWHQGTAEVWQEHFATGVVRTIVEACAPTVEEQAPAGRTPTVVLAAPSDEYHDLGLRMLADRFALAGWRTHFLGADVPLEELAAAVDELGADAVTLSASTHFHRLALKQYAASLAESRPQLRIWVGGAAFAHEHDGWPAEMVLDPLAVPEPEAD